MPGITSHGTVRPNVFDNEATTADVGEGPGDHHPALTVGKSGRPDLAFLRP